MQASPVVFCPFDLARLHALVLEKINHGLVDVYPPSTASDQALWNAVLGAFQQQEQFIRAWLKSPPSDQ